MSSFYYPINTQLFEESLGVVTETQFSCSPYSYTEITNATNTWENHTWREDKLSMLPPRPELSSPHILITMSRTLPIPDKLKQSLTKTPEDLQSHQTNSQCLWGDEKKQNLISNKLPSLNHLSFNVRKRALNLLFPLFWSFLIDLIIFIDV